MPRRWQSRRQVLSAAQRANCSGLTRCSEHSQPWNEEKKCYKKCNVKNEIKLRTLLSPMQAPSRNPKAWQDPWHNSRDTSHLEGKSPFMVSQSMLRSLHQHLPSSSHILKNDQKWDIFSRGSINFTYPEDWPRVTHPAEQAQSPKVHRNPASLRPKARAKINKSFIVLDTSRVGYQVPRRMKTQRIFFVKNVA